MPMPFASYEQGTLDHEAEEAMFEWRAMLLAHQEGDQTLVSIRQLLGVRIERHSSSIDHS
jgi:hypothetical protein